MHYSTGDTIEAGSGEACDVADVHNCPATPNADQLDFEAMPLNPNCKIDRRALPAPELSQLGAGEEEYVALRSATEEALAGVWSDLLGVGKIGVHDDFFYVAGHSLPATRLISRVRERFETGVNHLFAAVVQIPRRRMLESSDPSTWTDDPDSVGRPDDG